MNPKISQKTLVVRAVEALANDSAGNFARYFPDQLPTTDGIPKISELKSCSKAGSSRALTRGSLAISPNGEILASADSILDRTIKIWDLRTGKVLRTLTGHSDSVVAVAFSSDSQQLVSGSKDTTIRIWDLHTGELVRTVMGHFDSKS